MSAHDCVLSSRASHPQALLELQLRRLLPRISVVAFPQHGIFLPLLLFREIFVLAILRVRPRGLQHGRERSSHSPTICAARPFCCEMEGIADPSADLVSSRGLLRWPIGPASAGDSVVSRGASAPASCHRSSCPRQHAVTATFVPSRSHSCRRYAIEGRLGGMLSRASSNPGCGLRDLSDA